MNELLVAFQQNLVGIALAFLRLAPIMLVPVLSPMARVPGQVRVMLTLVVAFSASQLYGFADYAATLEPADVFLVAPAQLFLGMALAAGYQAMVAAVMTIGRAMDLQMGFGAAGILDPTTRNSESMVGTLLMWLVFVLTIHLGLHYEILAALMISFQVYPLGAELPAFSPEALLLLMGEQFTLALVMALPVVVSLFIFDILLGITAKSMPQMNVYFVMLPLKMFVGMVALGVTVSTLGTGIAEMFERLRAYWLGILSV